MIKLMNMSQGHLGNPIYINPDYIVSVYPLETDSGSMQTIVYGSNGGAGEMNWIVEEGLEEVIKKIENYRKSFAGVKYV